MYGFGKFLLINDTDVDTGTEYTSSVDVKNLPVISAHIYATANMVVTAWGTVQPASGDPDYDGTAESWVDITKAFTDLNSGVASSGSVTNTTAILQANGLCINRIRFKLEAGADNQTARIWLARM